METPASDSLMGRIAFENFGLAAERVDNDTVVASRYLHQAEEEKNIVPDIVRKLEIRPSDQCLEIGCGTGNILVPLSSRVRSIAGIDHAKCLETLGRRVAGKNNIELIPGNFLDIKIEKGFDKIIVYSVLQYLKDENETFSFINKAILLLNPGGRLLLGDIPNVSKEKRFIGTKKGSAYQVEWERKRAESRKTAMIESIGDVLVGAVKDTEYVVLDDDWVLAVLAQARKKDLDSYVFPQPENLPFGYFREDIIIEKNGDK